MAATLKQVADHVGVSLSTVSHILNNRGRFKSETRRKVLQAAERLAFVPNAAARAVQSQRSQQVGVLIVNDPAHHDVTPQNFFVITGLNDGLQSNGYVLSIIRVADVLRGPARAQSRVFREHLLDAMVVLNETAQGVEDRVVTLGRRLIWADTTHWEAHNCIRPVEVDAGRMAAQALVDGGATQLLWLGPAVVQGRKAAHYSCEQRRAGAQAAADAAGVALDSLSFGLQPSADCVRGLAPYLRPGVGVVVHDIHRARGVAAAAMDLGCCPGRDFGLASCEIVPEMEWTWPELARAGFDRYQFGLAVAEMMLKAFRSAAFRCPSQLFPCQFIAGTTARCGGR